MSANTSSINSSTSGNIEAFAVFQNVFYMVAGAPTTTLSILFTLAVLRNKSLRERNDLIIYCGLAAADSLFGLACFSAGARRLWVLSNAPRLLGTTWYCMYATVHSPLFIVAHCMVPLMYCAIAIDRLICVLHVTYYINLARSYALTMLAGPLTITAVATAVAWILSYNTPRTGLYPAVCVVEFADPSAYSEVMYTVEATVGAVTCLLYLVVMVSFKLKEDTHFVEARLNRIKERERKVTKTLGLISAFTFVLFVLPFIGKAIISFVYVDPPVKAIVAPILTALALLNSLCNVILYLFKQKDIRQKIVGLFVGVRVAEVDNRRLVS